MFCTAVGRTKLTTEFDKSVSVSVTLIQLLSVSVAESVVSKVESGLVSGLPPAKPSSETRAGDDTEMLVG